MNRFMRLVAQSVEAEITRRDEYLSRRISKLSNEQSWFHDVIKANRFRKDKNLLLHLIPPNILTTLFHANPTKPGKRPIDYRLQ
jgi:hypothetical protein